MEVIVDFIVLSLSILSIFLLANIQANRLRGNESDYEALLAMKAAVSNGPQSVLSSWNNSLPFCQWKGVICSPRHKRVVILELDGSNLVGTLSPFVGNLTFLRGLSLYNNSFKGFIPQQITHLPRLRELDLRFNSFQGEIPTNFSRCFNLRGIFLSYNNLRGRIPPGFGNLPNLVEIHLATNSLTGDLQAIGFGNLSKSFTKLILDQNHLEGSIPYDIGKLEGLQGLSLGDNMLSGTIPISLFNLSSLKDLYLSRNQIHGYLPKDIGLNLSQLLYLGISHTNLVGHVPVSLNNLSGLRSLDISFNSFMGRFPFNGNNFPKLFRLDIESAFSLLGGEARDLNFLDTLTNRTNLTYLLIGGNSFAGTFPSAILNLSTSLQALGLNGNQIRGHLPSGLGRFVKLYTLYLYDNLFTGPIPLDIGKLESIDRLVFSGNNFSEQIPSSLGNLSRLSILALNDNNLQGSVPETLGNCQQLQLIHIASNKLSGNVPGKIFQASSLIELVIAQNNLQGSLPIEIGNLKNLDQLDVSLNRFSGEIPTTLGDCTSLAFLDMSQNSFSGSIPESLSPLKSIQKLDLSHNNFSGQIPTYFSSWPYLSTLNLSFNFLEGEVPSNGSFANISIISLVGNKRLCGGIPELHLQRCPPPKESRRRRRLSLWLTIVIASVSSVLILLLSIAFCFYIFCSSTKRNASSSLQNTEPFLLVSYQMLLRATNGFSPSNVIGTGGFGTVYKGILQQDDVEMVVAVKVLNLQNQGASTSFIAECKALSNIRHRNLVKIITVCSSTDPQRNDFKALVYEYMSQGSLETWLHTHSCSLSLLQRLNIAIDVASALEYLHTRCVSPIIHCDLKPANILLDDEMIAHVGDFGLAKFILGASTNSTTNQTSSTQVRGTIGYVAPEYGLGSNVSPEGDIYSFGIIVLEMMTSKKPTDPMFFEGLNLHDFAKSALPDRVMGILDQRMVDGVNVLFGRNDADIRKFECIKSLVMVGVDCSRMQPQERPSINNVLNELKSARQIILSGPRNQNTKQVEF